MRTGEMESLVPSMTGTDSKIASLLALMLVDKRPQTDQISLLSRAGFKSSEIAGLLGTTVNTVSVALSKEKREKKKRRAT